MINNTIMWVRLIPSAETSSWKLLDITVAKHTGADEYFESVGLLLTCGYIYSA